MVHPMPAAEARPGAGAAGGPGEGYPWPWSVVPFLPGTPAAGNPQLHAVGRRTLDAVLAAV